MSIKVFALVLPLVLCQGLALAQTGPDPDPNCPLKQGMQKQQLASGRVTIMTTKNPGNKNCRGTADCTNEVEVQSFTRANGDAACCTRVEWASLTAIKGNHQVPLKWKLKPLDGKSYVFNPDGVSIIAPPSATPADLEGPRYNGNRSIATFKSVNNRAVTFNYGVSVSQKLPAGKYLACDLNDPIIVNEGS